MPHDDTPRSTDRIARLIAIVAGIAGALLCALVPLLPVTQTTATISWPQGTRNGHLSDITAPLVAGAPQALDITIPCTAIATLPADGGLVLSTVPAGGVDATKSGLFVRATRDTVVVAFRDTVAVTAKRSQACQTLHIWADARSVGADFIGIPGATGILPVEKKPQVVGVFTDLTHDQPGLSARVDIDTRFLTHPTTAKAVAMGLGAVSVLASLIALAVLDRRSGHRLTQSRRKTGIATWIADTGVIGTLGLWHLIGATSTDDGYNLTIARVAGNAGYIANYYRFFGATEAPFDWYPALLSHLAQVSAAGVWMRLPATLAGVATWLLISRFVLRRLGPAKGGLAGNRVAVWTAAAVFLAAWLPFNNGLRPEPLIALGALLTWALVEAAIATRQLSPAALAVVAATFTAALAPQGLIAIAALLAGARAIAVIVGKRRAADGLLALLAPLAAAFTLVAVVVFRSQTLATVAESARIKYVVGPTVAWYQDFLRYYFLTLETVDGSMPRRFAVLTLLLSLLGVLVVLLRRGKVAGLASGPVWRLLGTTAIGLLLLHFCPTKWVVQFGAFAGLAGALGAVTAFAFARIGLHSRRNLSLYVTALLFLLAWAAAGYNSWFYVGAYGVPWFDIQPVIASHPVTSMFLAASIGTGLLAAWQHFRLDYAGHTEVANTRRNRVLASTPLLVVAVVMVLLEVGSMTKAFVWRYPVYTTAGANLAALRSGLASCGLADDVLAEPDTTAGLLQPAPGQKYGPAGPLGGADPIGFTPNGVADDLKSDPLSVKPGLVNSDASPDRPNAAITDAAGTAGGRIPPDAPAGMNGSRVVLPFGLDPAKTPVLGSYKQDLIAHATSVWYQLGPRTPERQLVVVAAAGAILSHEEDGTLSYGQPLKLEWGITAPDGTVAQAGIVDPIDLGPQRSWRNLRFPLAWAPPQADVARIVAVDPNLTPDQWFAFTPPRIPVTQTLQQLIGSTTPVLLDLATAANFPCQRPFSEHLGVAELPAYRILPDRKLTAGSSNTWQSAEDGGPFLFTVESLYTSSIPTYLRGDWFRDWGSVERYHRLVPPELAPDAVIEQGVTTVPGWSRRGPIRALP